MSEPPSDEALVAAFKETGRKEVLDDLISRYVKKVRAVVYPMVLNEADADDVTQKAFVRAIRGIGDFRGDSRFSTWLNRVAMNTARGFLREKSRSQAVCEDDLCDRIDSRALGPEQFAIAAELEDEMSDAMRHLPTNLRAAIVLTALNGLDASEAARIEGCTTATMYWRIHKARKMLKKRLARHLQ